MGRGNVVFLVAVGVTGLHIVDDSFVNCEPGTSAGDHLVSGLVPLAGLAAAAVVYPRVRAGARGTIALFLGLFALTTSAEGWSDAVELGPTGDDYSGLVAGAAGVVLVVLGLVTLWRSRRRGGRWWWRYLRRGLIGVTGLVLLVWVIGPFLLTYAFTHVAAARPAAPDLGGADYREVTFETSDGLRLTGWYLPSTNGAAVIDFPGRDETEMRVARFLSDAGYGVLLFDPRGEADSEGEPNAYGWDGDKDVEAAIAFLQGRPEVRPDRIGGIGFSVGGELMLQVAAADDDLKAVVSEGAGIRSHREELELSGVDRWLEFPTYAASTLGTAIFSNSTPPPNLMDLVGKIAPRPLFLIHAEHGQGGEQLNPAYYRAAGDPKQLWLTDSRHVGGYGSDPDRYRARVLDIFDGALLLPEAR